MTDPGTPVFDSDHLALVCGDDLEFQCEIIGDFLAQLDARMDDIAAAVSSLDPAAVHHAAHALKGSSASLGAPALAEASGRLESLGRSSQLEGAPGVFEQVGHEASRLRETLNGFLRDRAA